MDLKLWLAGALKHANISQSELARRLTERGLSVDRAAVNKMLGRGGKPRDMSAAEMLAIAEITGAELPLNRARAETPISAGIEPSLAREALLIALRMPGMNDIAAQVVVESLLEEMSDPRPRRSGPREDEVAIAAESIIRQALRESGD